MSFAFPFRALLCCFVNTKKVTIRLFIIYTTIDRKEGWKIHLILSNDLKQGLCGCECVWVFLCIRMRVGMCDCNCVCFFCVRLGLGLFPHLDQFRPSIKCGAYSLTATLPAGGWSLCLPVYLWFSVSGAGCFGVCWLTPGGSLPRLGPVGSV
ncbi:hypothetical protein XENOCAPTIV_018485 [Xenoophorus captivus]|uniref:Secreted protein n=1 Tax=Xenoophorus captivus TaxID=1517983 RepID=A0ABV0QM78_9TELE